MLGTDYLFQPQTFTLRQLQTEQRAWAQHNFPGRDPWQPLLGVVEEVGELSHAHLKAEQGIRTNQDHAAAKIDAIGDIVIYLADYCSANGICLHTAVETTWRMVQRRDWQNDPAKGTPKEPKE